jgi:hypothetical protein
VFVRQIRAGGARATKNVLTGQAGFVSQVQFIAEPRRGDALQKSTFGCHRLPVDIVEHLENNVPVMFNGGWAMVRTFLEEVFALASLTLFLATIAVWVQLLGVTM